MTLQLKTTIMRKETKDLKKNTAGTDKPLANYSGAMIGLTKVVRELMNLKTGHRTTYCPIKTDVTEIYAALWWVVIHNEKK